MWVSISASVVGTSHQTTGTPCQDSCEVLRSRIGEDDVLLAALSDGAGSASHSQIGSKEAVQALLKFAVRDITDLSSFGAEKVRSLYRRVLEHLVIVGEREGVTLGQLACTLLFAVVWRNGAAFAQVGDGAWVVNLEGQLISGTWPETGEFANVTVFLTTKNALESEADESSKHFQFRRVEGIVNGVAGFTDGLQMIALDYASKIPFAPFFERMLAPLRDVADETQLIAPLQEMLSSDLITSRTDDDKSLILALWRETGGEGQSHVSAE